MSTRRDGDLGESDVLADRLRPDGPPEKRLDDFSDAGVVQIAGDEY